MDPLNALHPRDEHNLTLERHVHPPDYVNPQPKGRYNLVVIGAGTAGLVTAAGAAGLGAKVALIERGLMGGDCLNVGCVPSKAILSSARAAAAVRAADRFGVEVPAETRVDFGAVMKRMRSLRAGISPHDSVKRFTDLGVDVYLGQGRFVDAATVEVAGRRLPFAKAVVATGARASAPPVPGLTEVDYLTNETLFTLTELPRRFGVIGAGPIGVEMAQAFARFGSDVCLVEVTHGVLPREDRDAARIVEASLRRDGVRLLCCGKDLKITKAGGGGARLTVESHEQGYEVVVDKLLVAAGRAPNTEDLDLEKAGIEYSAKGVAINDFFQTTNPNVYAAGDICSPYQFTHAADFMARSVVRNALFHGRARHSGLVIPWCTYTSPELARVGWIPEASGDRAPRVDTFTQPMSGVDRALLEGEAEGFVRVHVRKGTDQIVGGTIVSAHAGELIGELAMAMTHRIGLGAMANVVHPYPTQTEAVRKVGDLYNRTRLTPFVKRLFQTWLAWRR